MPPFLLSAFLQPGHGLMADGGADRCQSCQWWQVLHVVTMAALSAYCLE